MRDLAPARLRRARRAKRPGGVRSVDPPARFAEACGERRKAVAASAQPRSAPVKVVLTQGTLGHVDARRRTADDSRGPSGPLFEARPRRRRARLSRSVPRTSFSVRIQSRPRSDGLIRFWSRRRNGKGAGHCVTDLVGDRCGRTVASATADDDLYPACRTRTAALGAHERTAPSHARRRPSIVVTSAPSVWGTSVSTRAWARRRRALCAPRNDPRRRRNLRDGRASSSRSTSASVVTDRRVHLVRGVRDVNSGTSGHASMSARGSVGT